MALRVEQIFVSGFDSNFSYLIYCEDSKEAFIVDPSGNFQLVLQKIEELQLNVVAIILTHTHYDHIDALPRAQELFAVPIFVHELGAAQFTTGLVQPLIDGDEIELGESMIAVAHTPGHSADSVCYLFKAEQEQSVIITGDTLFVDGCGRTDDQGALDLYNSLQFIKELPPETLVLPGHDYGPQSFDTLGNQLLTNRFLQADDFPSFSFERLGYTLEL